MAHILYIFVVFSLSYLFLNFAFGFWCTTLESVIKVKIKIFFKRGKKNSENYKITPLSLLLELLP